MGQKSEISGQEARDKNEQEEGKHHYQIFIKMLIAKPGNVLGREDDKRLVRLKHEQKYKTKTTVYKIPLFKNFLTIKTYNNILQAIWTVTGCNSFFLGGEENSCASILLSFAGYQCRVVDAEFGLRTI